MSGHEYDRDCGYDYNNTWDYECQKPRRSRRHSKKRRDETRWGYNGW